MECTSNQLVNDNMAMLSAICSIDAIEGDRMINEVVSLLEESQISPHTYMVKIDILHVRHGLAFGPNSMRELESRGYCELNEFCNQLLESVEEEVR